MSSVPCEENGAGVLTIPKFKAIISMGLKLYVNPVTANRDNKCWLVNYDFEGSPPIYASKRGDGWWFYGGRESFSDVVGAQYHAWEKAEQFFPHLMLGIPDYYNGERNPWLK
jgi:hypothetical protein